jgi:uncharacterized repeat protein (TIGR03803 family)
MRITKFWILCAAVLAFATLSAVGQVQYEVLYAFGSNGDQTDGAGPQGKLLMDKVGNLYGTTAGGGLGFGTVFELSRTQGGAWTETVLYNFCTKQGCADGSLPTAGLISDQAGDLFGTTSNGGQGIGGVVFELSPPKAPGAPWTEVTLYAFGANGTEDGCSPLGKLIFDAFGNLYGTTSACGTGDAGTVFQLTPSGDGAWQESVLYNFCQGGDFSPCPDGSGPVAGGSLDGIGNLYGTTERGGSKQFRGRGVVYRLSPGLNGWTETVLYDFSTPSNLHGANPMGTINFDSAGNLYSTVRFGGQSGFGGVFRLSPSKQNEYTVSFSGALSRPMAGVLIDPRNGNLYGTSSGSGLDSGSVFKVAGKKTSILYAFTGGSDGGAPVAGLIADKNGHLYGTTQIGGDFDQGVVFEIIP